MSLSLLKEIAQGKESALARLMDDYGARLLSFVYKLFGNHAFAEDVVQETFLNVWRFAGSFKEKEQGDPQKAFEAWLYRLARHKAVDLWRREKPAYELPETLVDERQNVERISECRRDLHRLLLSLPENARSAVILRYYEGFSQKEAAAVLNVSEKALESLLSRAKSFLVANKERGAA